MRLFKSIIGFLIVFIIIFIGAYFTYLRETPQEIEVSYAKSVIENQNFTSLRREIDSINRLIEYENTEVQFSDTIQVVVTNKEREEIEELVKQYESQIIMMAKLIHTEAGGIPSKMHRAAVGWCILNRVDSSNFSDTIEGVITSPGQFAWGRSNNMLIDTNYEIAKDVVTRWLLEKNGHSDVGRVLPSTYYYFAGDGLYNHYRQNFDSRGYWDWSLENPYDS